jgi:hypothetical protein
MTRPTTQIHRHQFGQCDIDGLVLYRCYGLDGTLMYIGQTNNLKRRIAHHRSQSPWWFAVENIAIEQHRNRRTLRQNELRAITKEWPFFNQHGKGYRQVLAIGLSDRWPGLPLWSDGGKAFHNVQDDTSNYTFVSNNSYGLE